MATDRGNITSTPIASFDVKTDIGSFYHDKDKGNGTVSSFTFTEVPLSIVSFYHNLDKGDGTPVLFVEDTNDKTDIVSFYHDAGQGTTQVQPQNLYTYDYVALIDNYYHDYDMGVAAIMPQNMYIRDYVAKVNEPYHEKDQGETTELLPTFNNGVDISNFIHNSNMGNITPISYTFIEIPLSISDYYHDVIKGTTTPAINDLLYYAYITEHLTGTSTSNQPVMRWG